MIEKFFKLLLIILFFCKSNSTAQDKKGDFNNDQCKNETCLLSMNQIFSDELMNIFRFRNNFLSEQSDYYRYFHLLRFLKVDTNLYFTIGLCRTFPENIKVQDGLIKLDTKNLYYYMINCHELLINDYNDSDGHGLYIPSKQTNKQALIEKKESPPFIFMDKEGEISYYQTYQVLHDSIIKVPLIIPIRYDNEDYSILKIINRKKCRKDKNEIVF